MKLLEMSWYKIFYWLTRADDVKHFLDIFSNWTLSLGIISTVVYLIMFIISKDSTTSDTDRISAIYWRKSIGKLTLFIQVTMLILWAGWVLVPTKKECLLIAAGGGAMNYLTQDSLGKQIPHELSGFVITELKAMSKDAQVELAILSNKDRILEEAKSMTTQQLMDRMKIDSNFSKIILNK